MLINKLILKILSPNYRKALDDALYLEDQAFLDIDRTQKEKLEELIKVCKRDIPFYKNVLPEGNITINDFPISDKGIINSNFNDFININLPETRRKSNSTSGSSGTNFKFYSDRLTDVKRHALANLGEKWAGANFGIKKLIIWGAERDLIKKSLKDKVINSKILFNTQMLSSYHMSNEDIEGNILPLINRFNPKVIIGYPSSLNLIANYIVKHNSPITKGLKGIITSGESLSIDQRQNIEKAFKVKVFNRYGCRDVGPIAHECESHKGLHVFSSHVYVEILNEKGEKCLPGEIGQIVVTDLDNHVFPFVRYKIGDLGKWSTEKCECGRSLPLLESVVGRTFDLIIGTNNNRVPGNYFTLLRNKVDGIEQFQFIQDKIGSLELRLKTTNDYSPLNDKLIVQLIKEKLGEDMNIIIKHVDDIEVSISGKYRWVISNVDLYEI